MDELPALQSIFGLQHSMLDLPELDPYNFSYKKEDVEIIIFPQLHDQVIFSHLATKLLKRVKPSCVGLELPEDMKDLFIQAIQRLPVTTLVHDKSPEEANYQQNTGNLPNPLASYVIHPGEALYWIARLALTDGFPLSFIDKWHPESLSSWYLPLDTPALASIGWRTFWENGQSILETHLHHKIHPKRSIHLGKQIIKLADSHTKILVLCGAAHWPIIEFMLEKEGFHPETRTIPHGFHEIIEASFSTINTGIDPITSRPNWKLTDIHPHSLHLVINDLPYFLSTFAEDPENFDWMETLRKLFFDAEINYTAQFDDKISPASYRRLFQYMRNLCRLQGKILPTLLEIITVSKAMVDDDYAFEVYKIAVNYVFPPKESSKLDEMIKFRPDEGQGEIIKFAFRRRFKRSYMQKLDRDNDEYDMDPIPEEIFPGQWKDIWDKYSQYGMVSYPPEDEYIENYLNYLRKRIHEIIMEEQASSIKFESSLEDGIDYRTTARHWHEGEIYVKKIPKRQPDIGILIVQFLEEPFDEQEYSHHSTLFAEHDQESHISIVTTEPGQLMIGPGITRVKYAAIISQFPPIAWPALIVKGNDDLKTRLLSAAMDMSLSKIIGFVAPKPPTAAQRHFASSYGFRIVYLPMAQLTKANLHRLRTMHLLANRELRDIAREYIGF